MFIVASSCVLHRLRHFAPVTCRLILIIALRCALCTMYSGLQPFLMELRLSLASYFLHSLSHIFAESLCVQKIYSCCTVASYVTTGRGCLVWYPCMACWKSSTIAGCRIFKSKCVRSGALQDGALLREDCVRKTTRSGLWSVISSHSGLWFVYAALMSRSSCSAL